MMILMTKIIILIIFFQKFTPSGEPPTGVTLGGEYASGGPLRGG